MGKAVIFDWGGVLMRTHDRSGREEWDRKLSLPQWGVERVVHGSEAWNEAQRGERSVESYWQAVAGELGISPDDIPQLRRDFYRGDKLDHDLLDLIRDLRAEGHKVGLMSNNSLHLLTLMEEHRLDGLFDGVVISAQIGVMKPSPEAFHAILDKLGVSASDAVFVDDFLRNVEGARVVGMHAVHFKPGLDLRSILRGFLTDE
jgi:putative hydrolase of the HAD superfamily